MSTTEADLDVRVGARIRALRMERSLTLEALADRAAVSRAMLSRIERGESSPTAQLLNKVCGGLGVTLSALFAHAEAAADPLSRRADQPTWRDPATGYLRRTISPAGGRSSVDIVEIEFPAGGSVAFDRQFLPGADQHVWVLEGTLELTVGEQVFRLGQGDCLLMRFGQPVHFRNQAQQPVRYAVIISHGAARA